MSAKQPKNAAQVIISLAQIAMGIWGIKTGVGQACDEVKKMAEAAGRAAGEATAGAPGPKPDAPAPKPTAPAEAPKPTEAPKPVEAPTAPSVDLGKYTAFGSSKAEKALDEIAKSLGEKGFSQATLMNDGFSDKFSESLNGFAKKVGEAVSSGKFSPEQGKSVLQGFADTIQQEMGSPGLAKKILPTLLKKGGL
jgi:hypothetical protein